MSTENRLNAIAQIEQTLRNLGLVDFAGEAQLLEWAKSTSRDGPKVKLLLPDDESIEPFQRATVRKGGQAGQLYYVFAIPLDEPMVRPPEPVQPLAPPKPSSNPLAGELHRIGYFRNPKLWAAIEAMEIYTQTEHKAWIESLPCCWPRVDSFQQPTDCAGDVCAHHCASAALPAAGKTTNNPRKPPHWYTVPLCVQHHQNYAHGSHGTRAHKQSLLEHAVGLTAERVKQMMKAYIGIESTRELTLEQLHDFERVVGLPLYQPKAA